MDKIPEKGVDSLSQGYLDKYLLFHRIKGSGDRVRVSGARIF
jgi:hypothetical protein